jgi:N-acetyl-gamma-glutamyl-phosphate/LysW-gamma-L-alpha-aminoadipyl-6-phosphate reductase
MAKPFGVAILGGSGYGAGEVMRLCLSHPEIEVAQVISRSHAGKPVHAVHTHLQSTTSLVFSESLSLTWCSRYEKVAVILAMPSGLAPDAIRDITANGLPENAVIIDLSGDLRLHDESVHKTFYAEVPYAPEIRSQRVYGLPELAREAIPSARVISNPGCLATAAILALAPLASKVFEGAVVVDGKTGTSGAGREPQASMHHPARTSDCAAYKILQHRHEPEILQALGTSFSTANTLMFIPHLLPVSRGILVTAYGTLRTAIEEQALRDLYEQFYAKAPFIRFRESSPRLADVVGTNFCDLHVTVRGKQVAILGAIDNLGKGMAGQCIQNLNLIFGLSEDRGLLIPALGPV